MLTQSRVNGGDQVGGNGFLPVCLLQLTEAAAGFRYATGDGVYTDHICKRFPITTSRQLVRLCQLRMCFPEHPLLPVNPAKHNVARMKVWIQFDCFPRMVQSS